jgi:hypothetical protein
MLMQIRHRSRAMPPCLWRESNSKARIESSTNDQNPMPLRVHHAKTLTLRVTWPTSPPSPDPLVRDHDRIDHCRFRKRTPEPRRKLSPSFTNEDRYECVVISEHAGLIEHVGVRERRWRVDDYSYCNHIHRGPHSRVRRRVASQCSR